MATTPWIQFNATTQTRNVDGVDEYRLIGVSPKPPFNVSDEINDKISIDEKGAVNGVATLDGGGKVPAAQLPNTIMELQGAWNASTNTPTLADGTGNAGDVYQVSVAGTQNLGSGAQTFAVNDFVIYGASGVWFKSENSNAVTSVFGRVGAVTAQAADYAAFYPTKTGTGASGTWGINISGSASSWGGIQFNGGSDGADISHFYVYKTVTGAAHTVTAAAVQATLGIPSGGINLQTVLDAGREALYTGTSQYGMSILGQTSATNIFRAGFSGLSNGFTVSSDGTKMDYQFLNGSIYTEGYGTFTDGTQGLKIGAFTGGAGYGALYSSSVTPGGANWSLATNATTTTINGATSSSLAVGGTEVLTATSTGVAVTGSATASSFIKSGGTSAQSLMADGSVQTVTSGTYTPTISDTSNISASSVNGVFFYTRIGNIVEVFGSVLVTTTSLATSVGFQLSLPVSSDFTSSVDLVGILQMVNQSTVTQPFVGGQVVADATLNTASCSTYTPILSSTAIRISFSYIVK